jgi:arylsulfatase A-like enzyme
MKRKLLFSVFILHVFLFSFSTSASHRKSDKKMNVLFIAVDDLRLQAGIYGQDKMHTPIIDKLGNEGVVFSKAYCSVPVCGASRASILSGLRPTATRFVNYHTKKDIDAPNVTSLPKWFKENGYTTLSRGKVYHHPDDDLGAWSEEPWDSIVSAQTWRDYVLDENIALQNNPDIKSGPAYECADVADNAYRDGKFADKAIDDLKRFEKTGEPFFLALGFVKPHLPFNAPKKYWDLYNEEQIVLPSNQEKPENAPKEAMHTWGELRSYHGIPKKGPLPNETAKKLAHGYYASVSYTDAQIGKVLTELERLGLAENTVVVLWGDHGWHLGEHGLWCKHCNFDRVMNAPLIIRAPGITSGAKTETLVEFVDVYPTLCDLTGLKQPSHLDGKSLLPVLENPDKTHKKAVFSRYHDGESVITKDFIYTTWIKDGKYISQMLFDHKNDPAENINVAEKPAYKKIVAEMNRLLEEKNQSLTKR